MTILITRKVDLRTSSLARGRKGHFKMIEIDRSRDHNNPECVFTQYHSFKLYDTKTDRLDEKKNESSIIVGSFNNPLLLIDKKRRQKISKDVENMNNTRQVELINISDIFGISINKDHKMGQKNQVPTKRD